MIELTHSLYSPKWLGMANQSLTVYAVSCWSCGRTSQHQREPLASCPMKVGCQLATKQLRNATGCTTPIARKSQSSFPATTHTLGCLLVDLTTFKDCGLHWASVHLRPFCTLPNLILHPGVYGHRTPLPYCFCFEYLHVCGSPRWRKSF